MEDVLLSNIKSAITFMHLAGLALGIGGAWMLDLFILKHFRKQRITQEKYEVIGFVSGLVVAGLVALWVSGALFLLYYYLFTPEFLGNEKVWGKVFIVTALIINGVFVHRVLLKKLQAAIGQSLLESLSPKEVRLVVSIGTISFLSWMVPMVLGVSKTLNFSIPAVYIIAAYSYVLLLALILADTVVMLLQRNSRTKAREALPLIATPAM